VVLKSSNINILQKKTIVFNSYKSVMHKVVQIKLCLPLVLTVGYTYQMIHALKTIPQENITQIMY